MASFSRMRDDLTDELEDQIASLRKEMTALRKQVSKRGARAYRDARGSGDDLVELLRDYAEEVLPSVRRGAHAMERTALHNPKTTVATALLGAAVIGLAAAFLSRR